MTDGSFRPPPGFQPPAQPVPPGGYVGSPPDVGFGAPPPGSVPPPPRRDHTGWWIGCGGGCLVLLLLLAVGIFFIKPLALMMIGWIGIAAMSGLTSGAVVWHATSPDGARLAELRRTGLGSVQLVYTLSVTPVGGGDRCSAAFVYGDRANDYVHVQWVGPTALIVHYGAPTRSGVGFQAPSTATGRDACRDITVTALHDPSLDAMADAANGGSSGDDESVPPVRGEGAEGKPSSDAPAPAPDQGSGDQDVGGGK